MSQADVSEGGEAMPTYLRFTDLPRPVSARTRLVAVASASRGDRLGTLGWYGSWRCYALEALPGVVWSAGCLEEVARQLAAMTAHHAGALAARRRTPTEVA